MTEPRPMTEHEALISDIALRLGQCDLDELGQVRGYLDVIEARRRPARMPDHPPHSDESHEWDRSAHLTRTSLEPARMALDETEDPYDDLSVDDGFDSSDVGGGCEDG